MAKQVSVKSIRELAKQQGINDVKSIEINGLEIEIKKFLPIEKKREIALIVNQNSFVGDSDLKLYDKSIEDVMFNSLIISGYTNINSMKDYFEFYDCLKVSGLLESIIGYIESSEIEEIRNLVESRKQDNFRVQELRGLMGYKLEDLFAIIGDKIDLVSDKIADFDPNMLKTLTSFMPEDKQKELLEGKKMSKEERDELEKISDEAIESKIKAVENKVSKISLVSEKNDIIEGSNLDEDSEANG